MISLFGIRCCPLDLVMEGTPPRLSATKTWMHAANVIMSVVILRQNEMTWELLATYGAIVGGNHIAIFWLKRKYPCEEEKQP